MDPVVAAIISGLLGGGVAGAIIGALVTLRQQRRAFEHEKTTRFTDLKRQRYADLLQMVDDWIRMVVTQHTVAVAMMTADASAKDMPTLGPITVVEQLGDEMELLGSEAVGRAATRLMVAVGALRTYAHDPDRDVRHMVEPVVSFREAMAGYTVERSRFVAAAKADLGTL